MRPPELRLFGFWDAGMLGCPSRMGFVGSALSYSRTSTSSDEDMYMELLTCDVVRYSGTQHLTRAYSPPLLSAIEHVH